MEDVRLTATNTADSSIVPVACNDRGELLLEEPIEGPVGPEGPQGPRGEDGDPFTGDFSGDVNFDNTATFAGNINANKPRNTTAGPDTGGLSINPSDSTHYYNFRVSEALDNELVIDTLLGPEQFIFDSDGSAIFKKRLSTPEVASTDAADYYLSESYRQNAIGSERGAGLFRLTDTDGTHGEQIALRISQVGNQPNDCKIKLNYNGSAAFSNGKAGFNEDGELIVFSRGKRWKAIESNSIMMLEEFPVEQEIREKLSGVTTDIDNPRQPRD